MAGSAVEGRGRKPPDPLRPISLSWILETDAGEGEARAARTSGRLGLCFCPGKQMKRGPEVKERSMKADLARLRDHFGITTVICLLDKYELRSIGISGDYKKLVEAARLEFGPQYPIIEMAAPPSTLSLHELVCDLADRMMNGQSLAVHCKWGVGRAATVACCVALYMGACSSPKVAISKLRELRCRTAVESRKQEDFIAGYRKYLSSLPAEPRDGAAGCSPGPRPSASFVSAKQTEAQQLSWQTEGLDTPSAKGEDPRSSSPNSGARDS